MQTRIRSYQDVLVVLTLFTILFWCIDLLSESWVPVVQASVATVAHPAVVVAPHVATAQEKIGVPVRLKIPTLKVNAVIRSVGLAPDGSMGTPKVARETAWYMIGPKPGEQGSAVIAGHVSWLYGATGAFQNLKKLKPGDKITVEDDTGAILSFVVRESRSLNPADNAASVFSSSDGKSHLNLITCDGVWDTRAKQYTKRLVVFADREIL